MSDCTGGPDCPIHDVCFGEPSWATNPRAAIARAEAAEETERDLETKLRTLYCSTYQVHRAGAVIDADDMAPFLAAARIALEHAARGCDVGFGKHARHKCHDCAESIRAIAGALRGGQ